MNTLKDLIVVVDQIMSIPDLDIVIVTENLLQIKNRIQQSNEDYQMTLSIDEQELAIFIEKLNKLEKAVCDFNVSELIKLIKRLIEYESKSFTSSKSFSIKQLYEKRFEELNSIENELDRIELNLTSPELIKYLIYEEYLEIKRHIQLYTEETIGQIRKEKNLTTELESQINDIQTKSESLIKEVNKHQNESISLYDFTEAKKFIQRELVPLRNRIKKFDYINSNINNTLFNFEELRDKVQHFIFGNNLIQLKRKDTINENEFAYYICFHQILSLRKPIHSSLFDINQKIFIASFCTIKLLNLNSGEFLQTFSNHSNLVTGVNKLNENKLFTCSRDMTVKKWDVTTGTCEKTYIGHSDIVLCILILTDDTIASGSADLTIRVWQVESGECIKILKGHSEPINCIAKYSYDCVISGSWDSTIKLWNLNSGECLRTFTGHQEEVMCVEVLSNHRILSGSYDKTIKIWNVNTALCLLTLEGHTNRLSCLKVLFDERIISGSADKTIKIWCLKTKSCIKTINIHSDVINGIQVISDQKIVSYSDDKTIKIWDLASAICFKTFQSDSCITSVDIL